MANSFQAITPIVIGSAMTAVQNKLAFLADFSTDLSSDIVGPKRCTVQVPLITSGSTTLVNPSVFGGSDTTASTVAVVMSAFHQPFNINSDDYNSGRRLEALISANMQKLAEKLQQVTFAKFTAANFGIGLSGVAPGAITDANLKTLWGSLKGDKKNAYLRSDAYANFLPTMNTQFDPQLGYRYIFDKLANVDSFADAEAGVYGVAANPACLAVASAIPDVPPATRGLLQTELIELPIGITVAFNYWGDVSNRGDNASFDCYYGVSVGDPSGAKLVKQ